MVAIVLCEFCHLGGRGGDVTDVRNVISHFLKVSLSQCGACGHPMGGIWIWMEKKGVSEAFEYLLYKALASIVPTVADTVQDLGSNFLFQ